MVRAMLMKLDKHYWAEASATAVYLKNRLPHSVVKGMTPYQALFNKKPKISHLQPFGNKYYVHIPEERRLPGSKLLPRAEIGIFFGYTDTPSIYKIHFPARKHTMTVNALDVSYSNSAPPAMPSLPTSPIPNLHNFVPSVSIPTLPVNRDEYISFSPQPSSPQLSLPQPFDSVTRSGRSIRSQVDDIHEVEVLVASAEIDNEPRSYKQAMKSADVDKWQIAMQDELNTLHANNTWSVVPLPDGRNVVGSKWVFKVKRDANGNIARYKARLVAQGFLQQPGTDFDEIFAPVVCYDSL